MKTVIVACATWVSFAAASSAMASNPIDLETGGWIRLSEGVYQREDPDGTITRMGFGAGGALYDRYTLEKEIEALSNEAAWKEAGSVDSEIAELKAALAGIPAVGLAEAKHASPIGIASSQTGALCGHWAYAFDSHLSVGKIGATVTARTGVGSDDVGPPLSVSSATQYARAIVTPSGGTAITTSTTLPDLSTWMSAATSDWVKNDGANSLVTSSSCTASTFSYVSVTAGTSCNPSSGGYASMTKSYATCVTTP